MFDIPISKMNDKQLRNAVQLLYDELAIFKRKYEDAIHNLDSDNLGKSFTVEQNKMKAQIKITAEGLKSTVSQSDFETGLSNCYSEIEQTAKNIRLTVDSLEDSVSEIQINADDITLKVSDLEDFKTSVFTQTGDGFTLDGEQTTFTGVIYLTDKNGIKRFAISHDESQGFEQIIIHSLTGSMPIVIGQSSDVVYIGSSVSGNEVTTRKWVEENANITARFG